MDRVDSASPIFNWLANRRQLCEGLRVIRYRTDQPSGSLVHFAVLSREELANEEIDQASFVIECRNPSSSSAAEAVQIQHRIAKLVEILPLEFIDAQPADHNHAWEKPVPEYANRLPVDILLGRMTAKQIWVRMRRPPSR